MQYPVDRIHHQYFPTLAALAYCPHLDHRLVGELPKEEKKFIKNILSAKK